MGYIEGESIPNDLLVMTKAQIPLTDWLVIVNPASGGGKGGNKFPAIEEEFKKQNIAYKAVFTARRGDAFRLAQEGISNGYRKLVAVGGDGTLNEMLNGAMGQQFALPSDLTVGIIPVGTGNDWIKTHKIPLDTQQAVALMADGYTKPHDVGYLSGDGGSRYFLNVAGFGFDAEVVNTVERWRKKIDLGKLTYLSALVSTLFGYVPKQVEVSLDGKKTTNPCLILAVGVCRYFGGGMMILPIAQPSDGWLDVSWVGAIGPLGVIRKLPGLMDGTYIKDKRVTVSKSKQVYIQCPQGITAETDGELMYMGKEFVVNIFPSAIWALVPRPKTVS